MTEAEVRETVRKSVREAYSQGALEAQARFAADLRALADDFTSQIFQLRCEIRRALKLPPPASPDDLDATLQ